MWRSKIKSFLYELNGNVSSLSSPNPHSHTHAYLSLADVSACGLLYRNSTSLCVNVQVCTSETTCSLLGGSQMRLCDYSPTNVISPLRMLPLNPTYPRPLHTATHLLLLLVQPIPPKSNLLWFQIRPRFSVLSPLRTKCLLLLPVQFETVPPPPFSFSSGPLLWWCTIRSVDSCVVQDGAPEKLLKNLHRDDLL